MKRKLLALLCAVFMLGCFITAAAAEVISGSISVSMSYRDEAVPGGTLTIYYVAAPGDGEYVYDGDFSDYGVSVTDISSARTAQDIYDYAVMMGIGGSEQTIDENGHICYDDLPLGLYLLVQETPADGYCPVAPFLVTIPGKDGEVDVDATPKLSLQPAGTQPETTAPTTPSKPTDSSAPQTGQLNWPVPILAICGIIIFTIGWWMRRRSRNKG